MLVDGLLLGTLLTDGFSVFGAFLVFASIPGVLDG